MVLGVVIPLRGVEVGFLSTRFSRGNLLQSRGAKSFPLREMCVMLERLNCDFIQLSSWQQRVYACLFSVGSRRLRVYVLRGALTWGIPSVRLPGLRLCCRPRRAATWHEMGRMDVACKFFFTRQHGDFPRREAAQVLLCGRSGRRLINSVAMDVSSPCMYTRLDSL